jgi:hypothetical protein
MMCNIKGLKMLRQMLLISLLLTSGFSSSDLIYVSKEKSSLEKFISLKQSNITKNLSLDLNLGSALGIIDEDLLQQDISKAPKPCSPEQTLITLTYTF